MPGHLPTSDCVVGVCVVSSNLKALPARVTPDNVPSVSIGLPFFNAGSTLAASVSSILAQTFTDWELILLDDGSSDDSLAIARSFADPRIRVVTDGENRGISHRLNQAVSLARGRYFFRMDGDDLAFSQRLQQQHDFLVQHPEVDLVASNAIFFKEADDILGTLNVSGHHAAIVARPYAGFYMPHPSWAGRRQWFVDNPYNPDFNGAEDQELLYRTWRSSVFACIEEPLICYREAGRDFGKVFKRRKTLARAMLISAYRQGRIGDMGRVSVVFLAKVMADFANLKFGLASLRTRFVPAAPAQVEELRRLLSACTPPARIGVVTSTETA